MLFLSYVLTVHDDESSLCVFEAFVCFTFRGCFSWGCFCHKDATLSWV